MIQRFGIQVRPEGHKMRLEDFLFDEFRTLSRLYLRSLIKNEKCEVNGRIENRGFRLRTNDFVEVEADPDRQNSMVPQDIPLEVVYEDANLIVVNKPVGMLVHPTNKDKTGTVLNALSYYLNSDPDVSHIRPSLVHRLDKETSGLLLVAKSARMHGKLGRQFQKRTVEKKYLALVEGRVPEDEGDICLPVGRYAEEKMWGVKDDGKSAHTRFRVLDRSGNASLLELEPVTGRTNQLRVHCAGIGHPIVGDTMRKGRDHQRLCLHAYRLVFRDPQSWEEIALERSVDFSS